MKYEFVHSNRISRDLYVDCDVAKLMLDKFCEGDKLKGYIQEIMLNPFGILLISEIQVRSLSLKVFMRQFKPPLLFADKNLEYYCKEKFCLVF